MPLTPTGNLLLDSLSESLRENILAMSRQTRLDLEMVLGSPGTNPSYMTFLTSGMASLVVTMANGESSEVGMLGREGFSGYSVLLGPDMHHPTCVMQIPGDGLQVPRQHLQDIFWSSREFQAKVLRATQRQLNISTQLTACGLSHRAEGRFARWLLTASDLTDSPTLKMTQEFLAQMLSTQRSTVSAVARPLIEQEIITMIRGTVRILDRPALAGKACECYGIARGLLAAEELALFADSQRYYAPRFKSSD